MEKREISFVEFCESVGKIEIQPWQKPIISRLEEIAKAEKEGKPWRLFFRPR